MRLGLLERPRTVDGEVREGGEERAYYVTGLPPSEHAKIAYFNNAWRLLRWNSEWHGNWTGNYATPDAALGALREELLTTVA